MEKMHLKREWEEAAAVISIARSTYLSNFFRVLGPLGVIKIPYAVFSAIFLLIEKIGMLIYGFVLNRRWL